jgi:CheY-like chemotaxis protein
MTDPVRILLVEDNTADVYLFRKALAAAGLNFELTVIEDGGSGMAFVRGEGEYADIPVPDLAVIDLSLPKNDGIQILEAFRATDRWRPRASNRRTCGWPAISPNRPIWRRFWRSVWH